MALLLKRGTNAQRLGYTPQQGELLFITDYDVAGVSPLWIGDGETAGGVEISSAGGGSGITDISQDTTPELGGNLNLATYEINGIGDIDISGTIAAQGVISTSSRFVGDLQGSIFADDSSLLVDGVNGTISAANLTGALPAIDGSALTGITVSGPFVGNLTGDVNGSVFTDSSSIIVDGTDGSLYTGQISSSIGNRITIRNSGTDGQVSQIYTPATNNRGEINLVRETTSDITGNTSLDYGGVVFGRDDANGALNTAVIVGRENALIFGVDSDGSFDSPNNFLIFSETGLGVRKTPTSVLDVNGDANFDNDVTITGSLTAGAMLLSGSIIDTSDSSAITVTPATTFSSDVTIENDLIVSNTLTVDTLQVTNFETSGAGTPELASDTDILLTAGTRVEITQSPFKVASFTTAERDALSAENGDIIYNTTDNKFQGYENGAWANLI